MWQGKYRIVGIAITQLFCLTLIESKAQAVSLADAGLVHQIRTEAFKDGQEREVTTSLLLEKEYKTISLGISNLKQVQKLSPVGTNVYNISDTANFYVRDIRKNKAWVTVETTLSYKKGKINIWLQTSAYDTLKGSKVFEGFLSVLDKRLFEETMSNSVDPNKGIIEILAEYAGEFPDVDGDGTLDIILLDIEDNFDESGSFVAGFFDPVNLIEHEFSNRKDIIYLDLYPTLFYSDEIYTDRLLSTLVHEAQHLIHAGYEGSEVETVFANEGFSEAIEIVSGFAPRSSSGYVHAPLRTLTSWDYENPIPDYSRASLWTHYLLEQFGSHILPELIQNRKSGISGYEEVLNNFSSLTFQEVFQNWGIAMTLNNVELHREYGYQHPDRKNLAQLPLVQRKSIPDIIKGSLPELSHALFSYPLSAEMVIDKGGDKTKEVKVNPIVSYPGWENDSEVIKNINSGQVISANAYSHGGISVLISAFQKAFSDSSLFNINLKLEGQKSGIEREWKYGDGINDVFYLNASYLTLNSPNQKLGIVFPPVEDSFWLKGLTLKHVFLSELTGTGVDGNEERDFELEVSRYKNGQPDEVLLSKKITTKRESGKLVKEYIPFDAYYHQLSEIRDSIIIVIGNDTDDQNFIALGMDKSSESSSLYFNEGKWEALSDKSIGGVTLEDWNPIIHAAVVISEKSNTKIAAIRNISYDFKGVQVNVNPGFEHDSSSIKMYAELPDGSFLNGKLLSKKEGYTFSFPVLVDGEYLFTASFTSHKGEYSFSDEETWSIDVPDGFILSKNYPNPFNPSTNITFTLIEAGELGWQVYDLLGRRVMNIPSVRFENGEHTQRFNFQGLANGMYLVRAELRRERNNRTINKTTKVMLIK